ncbi:MAG: hypothetical protein WB341_15765 [Terracidiphilus sp.]
MDAIPESASACALFLIASRNAPSIRVCQPRPVDLKWSITSGDRRKEISFFVGTFCGPRLPRRTVLSGWQSIEEVQKQLVTLPSKIETRPPQECRRFFIPAPR